MKKKNVNQQLILTTAQQAVAHLKPVSRSSQPQTQRKAKATRSLGITPHPASISSDGGQRDEMISKNCPSISGGVANMMRDTSAISTEGRGSIQTILNPCGEKNFDANAKFPDGTLSQSGVLRFRQFETIYPPFSNPATNSNVTNNWGLFGISPPGIKTIMILVATSDNSDLTDAQWAIIFTYLNNVNPTPTYPAWFNVIQPNVFVTVYNYGAANLAIDPASGESTSIESSRTVGDGFVLLHNCPTLWDQGSFAVGQFQTDTETLSTDETAGGAFISIITSALTATTAIISIVFPTATGSIVLGLPTNASTPTSTLMAMPAQSAGYRLSSPAPSSEFFYGAAVGVSGSVSITQQTTPFPAWVFTGVAQVGNSPIVIPLQPLGSTFEFALNITGALAQQESNGVSQVLWTVPPLNQRSIVQADPKFSAELMKDHRGFYAVRRYFQPKLSMKKSNDGGNIKISHVGMDRVGITQSGGGLRGDLLDLNAATICFAIRGISYACNPTIKSCRFIEYMPTEGSPLAPFVGPTPEKDEDAEEVFRQMQISGPHSYIPDANYLGFLASMITTTIELLPVFLRGARSVSHAIARAVDWVDEHYFTKVPQ